MTFSKDVLRLDCAAEAERIGSRSTPRMEDDTLPCAKSGARVWC